MRFPAVGIALPFIRDKACRKELQVATMRVHAEDPKIHWHEGLCEVGYAGCHRQDHLDVVLGQPPELTQRAATFGRSAGRKPWTGIKVRAVAQPDSSQAGKGIPQQ